MTELEQQWGRPIQAATKIEVEGQAIRKAYYDAADGVVGLAEAVTMKPLFKDAKLSRLVASLSWSLTLVQRHLDEHYVWD